MGPFGLFSSKAGIYILLGECQALLVTLLHVLRNFVAGALIDR